MAIRNDYVSGEQLDADDWNQVATRIVNVRLIYAPVVTYDEALAFAAGPDKFEIKVTGDSDPAKRGIYQYNGVTGVLEILPLMTPEMRIWILDMMQVNNT